MIKHVVSFKFRGTHDERKAVAEKFKEALVALPETIEALNAIEVGINENPSERWDLVLIAEVNDYDALAEYASHPLHVAATQIIKDWKEDRACVDYEV